MSRTDVHRNPDLQLNDWHNRHRTYLFASLPDQMQRVTWINIYTGRREATSYYWRKAQRRKSRHNARREILAQLNDQ